MRPFSVTILGSNSAIPAHGRHPSAQWLQIGSKLYLIDCGEGTQIRALQNQLKIFKLDGIFISHMHGDHVFGLPGLLTTLALLGRSEPLQVYGPSGLKEWLDSTFKISGARFSYLLEVVEVNAGKGKIVSALSVGEVEVHAFPLQHRIQTNGYLFTLKQDERKLDGAKVDRDHVPFAVRVALKQGKDVEKEDGDKWRFMDYTSDGEAARNYAYCSDTILDEGITPWIKNVNVLYHEATYLHDMAEQAKERFHTTALQCGQLASMAKVGRLLIGHASSRYPDVQVLEDEAKQEFENSSFAREGETYNIL